MVFFKRELTPVERFESALRDRRAARQKQADRVSVVEASVEEKRAAAERLAVAGASDAKLARAETKLRAVKERAKSLRAELAEFDEQVASIERALAEAKAQRDRDTLADQIEALAAAIEQGGTGIWRRGALALGGRSSQKARRRCRRRPGSRPAWRRCVRKFSRLRISSAGSSDPPRRARARATRTSPLLQQPKLSNRRFRRSTGNRFTRSTRCSGARAERCAGCRRSPLSSCQKCCCRSRFGISMWIISMRGACRRADPHSWQRRVPGRARSRRSATHRSRRTCRTGGKRPGQGCVSGAS